MAVSATTKLKRSRRTLNRLALGLLALGVGWLAQASLRQQGIWDGLLLFTVAAILFVKALGRVDDGRPAWWPPYPGLFAPLRLRSGNLGWVGIVSMFLALALSLLGANLFDNLKTIEQAWQLYLVSLLALPAGILFLAENRRPRGLRLRKGEQGWVVRFAVTPVALILLGILLLALIMRLWQFNEIPFGVWFDEAEAGLQARRWLEEADYKPAFYDPINVSGQFLALYAAGLRFMSDSVQGLRTVSVLFGVGGVLAAYLFGRALRGPRFGLIMAFLLAVMRWHLNFSRIAMTGVDAPFFELLSLYFLIRLTKRGHLRDAIFAGISLGLGLSFYTAFRLFVLALGVFVLLSILIWRHWRGRAGSRSWWGNQAIRVGVIILAAWIALMPVAQFSLRHPDSFSRRMQITSIFNRRDDPDLGRALRTSLGSHLGMFHILGDRNGRHNLPGEPMLDPLTGILVVLGLALALKNLFSRRARAAHLFFLLLIPVSLAGGILTLDFEAPQSLRSIAILPALIYLAALPVEALALEAMRVIGPLSPRWLWVPGGVAALYLLAANTHTYFVRQANDFGVWNQFSTAETITAQRMAELGPEYDFYLSPFLSNHPTVRFVSPDTPDRKTLPFPDALPIRTEATRPAALFIHPDEQWVFDEAQRLYPAAYFETASSAPGNPPSVHIVQLSTTDLASVQGLELRYWAGSEKRPDSVPVKALRVGTVDVDWASSLPLTPPYFAEWEGILYVDQYGVYRFDLQAPAEAVLEIDGVDVMQGQGEQATSSELARGNHTFRLTAQSGRGQVRLSWQSPGREMALIPNSAFYSNLVTNQGLVGKYYANSTWSGSPTLVQIDPFLNTYYHLTPLPRPYSVEWTGLLDVPVTGIYGLAVRSVGEADLYIDGVLVTKAIVPNRIFETDVSLEAGLHELKVLFKDTLPRSRLHLMWRTPGALGLEPIPASNLWPSLDSVQQPASQVVAAQAFEARPLTISHLFSLNEGLAQPRDIAVNSDGLIYVVDTILRGVQVFDGEQLLDTWTQTPDGPFEEPLAIVVDSDDVVWVLDSTRQWIYAFDGAGEPLNKIGGPEAQFYHPRGMALVSQSGADDTLIVANTGSGNLRLFARDGTILGSVGLFGDAPGQFNEPVDVLPDPFGAYYVTEGANINRWQRVDSFGKPIENWLLDAPVALDGSHMAWGSDRSIFMTNSGRGVVRRYGPGGDIIEEWQTLDGVAFSRPVGILVDIVSNRLLVSDIGTGQVHVFQIAGSDVSE